MAQKKHEIQTYKQNNEIKTKMNKKSYTIWIIEKLHWDKYDQRPSPKTGQE